MTKSKVAAWSAIALGGFYLFTQPKNAADSVGGVFSFAGELATSVITFLTALFN